MKAPSAAMLKEVGNSEKRIGPENKRSKASESSVFVEEFFLKHAPLPCTFDISPIQKPYFDEFSYHDVFGGIFGGSMNEEVNARIVETSAKNCSPDFSFVDKLTKNINDKYNLNSNLSERQAKKIIFFPGSNLLHVVNLDIVDRILFEDDSVRIKPHPIMTKDGLRQLGMRYGYWRLIPPSESGIEYLLNCDVALGTMNSEIGLMAAAIKKPYYDITKMVYTQKLTYATIHRLMKDNNIEHNYEIMARVLTSKSSGLMMPWHEDLDDRSKEFFKLAMEIRNVFKPSWPWLGETKNIKEL